MSDSPGPVHNSNHTADLVKAPAGILRILFENYGPYAFGVLSLLALWKFIVEPQMTYHDTVLQKFGEISHTNKETSDINARAAQTNKELALILENVLLDLRETVRDLKK